MEQGSELETSQGLVSDTCGLSLNQGEAGYDPKMSYLI